MSDFHSRAARDSAVRQVLADRVAHDADRRFGDHPLRRRRLVLLTAVVVLALGIGLPVSLHSFRGPDSSSAVSASAVSSNTLFSPPEPNHRVPNIGNLVDRPTVDFHIADSPDELAAVQGFVVVYGTIVTARGSGDRAVLTVTAGDGSQGHDHFQIGDDVDLILTSTSGDTRDDIARIEEELPAGTTVVAFGRPLGDGSIDLAGPQSLAVQLAGSDQVFWPGMGYTTGVITQALPGGTLVGPPIDTGPYENQRWVLSRLERSIGDPPHLEELVGEASAWWKVSSDGLLQYDAGCGTGTVKVVPSLHGYRVLEVMAPAPTCGTGTTSTETSRAFAAVFESPGFTVEAALDGAPNLYGPNTGYLLGFVDSGTSSTTLSSTIEFPSEVQSPVPATDPTTPPAETATPAVGLWHLADPGAVSADSTTIQLTVTRRECSGGKTGAVLPVEIGYESDRIVIRTPLVPNPPGAYDCPSNDSVLVAVELREPIGTRQLVDASCVDDEAVGTSDCSDGGVRWRP